MGAYVALATTILLWASAIRGMRAALQAYSPTHLVLPRFLIASVVMALIAGLPRIRLPHRRDVPLLRPLR